VSYLSAVASENLRIDKWLWCVRLFKTRTLATDAVNGGKVKLNGQNTKPSRELKPGDTIEFKRGVLTRTFRVAGFPKGRVSAKDVPLYTEDLTPPSELLKLEDMKYLPLVKREKGSGRPTKKDRRDMGRFME